MSQHHFSRIDQRHIGNYAEANAVVAYQPKISILNQCDERTSEWSELLITGGQRERVARRYTSVKGLVQHPLHLGQHGAVSGDGDLEPAFGLARIRE